MAYGMMGGSPPGAMTGTVTPPIGGGALTLGAGGAPAPGAGGLSLGTPAGAPAAPATPPPAPASSPAPIFPTGGMNPGEFAMGGGMMRTPPPTFTPDPSVLSRAGAAATPFGFGSPNPYAEFFGGHARGFGGEREGLGNAELMAELMAGTPTQPKPPPSVPINPVNIPPVTFS